MGIASVMMPLQVMALSENGLLAKEDSDGLRLE